MVSEDRDSLPNAPDGTPADGYRIGRVPVRNLWLLMFYASDLFKVRGAGPGGIDEAPDDLPHLVAEILAHSVEQRIRRHLTQGYQPRHAVLNRVRGRIDVLKTVRQRLLERGMVACRFEELTVNTPRNRLVHTALESVSRLVKDRDLRCRCRGLAGTMRAMGVSVEPPTRTQIAAERFGRNDAQDRVMVESAKLALELALPTEDGTRELPQPDREGTWVRNLFEKAVRGFYEVVLKPEGWRVSKRRWFWQATPKTNGLEAILPNMESDVVLEHAGAGRRIVIDTKFTSIVIPGWHREWTLDSGYIYQMYAYLQSQVGLGDPLADSASGILLHPAVGTMVDEEVEIQGHSIRFATVDLMASPSAIRSQLLRLCVLPDNCNAQ
ncbi:MULTISPECIES: 5-methylcytosine-specific restriction endonuclease system specificity protein McrC [unclassified Massilia]|uniref:5-methylcytosine-specific restriction endonuclease system specificity protein McrC n=1 Tax=unclassified Massilia TaxID=2609279 RepID=UPI0009EA5C50|nr:MULTISPECIES: 5-methylcytosine-specific restriction endonuclease system specificity protein McrC [unclassified Massilia]